MKKDLFTIREHTALTDRVYRMVLEGDTSAITAPGQFVNIALAGFYLRRPISVCDWDEQTLTILYKVVGEGTKHMKALPCGAKLDVLTGLGNGYTLDSRSDMPLLIGGGVGVPPLYGLAKALLGTGIQPAVILGFNTQEEIFYAEAFRALGVEVTITTVDGSVGVKGVVTDAMAEKSYNYVYTCGPEPMLRAIYDHSTCGGQYSFEERMGCGFGACMGCSCETKYGYKRICKEGPVLERGEILW